MSKKTNRKQRKDRGERDRIALKKFKEEQSILDANDRAEEVLDEDTLEPGFTDIEKHYSDVPYVEPAPGPTSFDELDAMREAEKKAHEVRATTWDVQDLVSNILRNDELQPTAKAKKITQVAADFEGRVQTAVTDDIQKDINVLQIEALLATHDRNQSAITKGKSWIQDRILKSSYLTDDQLAQLKETDFALQETRKYPLHNMIHVRKSLELVAQHIEKGAEDTEQAREALPELFKAAEKNGLNDGLDRSSIMIQKDKAGDWRWVGKPSNNFIDFDGDIISKEAHTKYVAWLEKNPDMYPVFQTWHKPGTARVSPADFAMEYEGALLMSGKLTEQEAGAMLKMQTLTDLGMSVAGPALRLNPDDPRVVTDYLLYEVSDLPLEKAANPFTSLEAITKEAGMDQLEYLTEMMGSEEKAKKLLAKTSETQQALKDAGIESKEQVDEVQTEVKVEETKPQEPTETAALDIEALTKSIVDKVGEELDVAGLEAFVAEAQKTNAKVLLLEGLVKEMATNKDDELAELLTPPASKHAWSLQNRASNSDETILTKDNKEDEDLESATPGVDPSLWLSNASKTVPVTE